MEELLDLSQATDEELKAELDGMQRALSASLGRPFDGREERNKVELLSKIEAIEKEIDRRETKQP